MAALGSVHPHTCMYTTHTQTQKDGWVVDGWMDGWMDGWREYYGFGLQILVTSTPSTFNLIVSCNLIRPLRQATEDHIVRK